MADNKVEVELLLSKVDNFQKSIDKVSTDTEKKFGDLGKLIESSIGGGFTDAALSAAKALAPLAASIAVIKTVVDEAFKGDQIKVINTQFELLTKQAGIASDTLRSQLVGAADGLIDDTHLIEAANKALISLGGNASKIPEVLEIARKSAAAFGGEATANFELINQAIASGNTRSLRQVGLFIDADTAIKKYAASLGVSVNSLNEAGRQQAIMNAVIEKGEKNFAAIDPTLNQTGTSFQRLKVSINDLNDSLAVIASSTFGTAIASTFNGLANLATIVSDKVKGFGGIDKLPISDQVGILNRQLEETGKLIQIAQNNIDRGQVDNSFTMYSKQADDLRLKLSLLDEERRKQNALEPKTPETSVPSPFDVNKAQLDAIKIQEIVAKADQDRINAQLAVSIDEDTRDELTRQKKLAAEQQFGLQRQEFILNEQINNRLSKDQENAALESMEAQHQANLLAIQTDAGAKQVALSKQLGATLNQGLANAIAAGVQSIVQSVRSGENAFGNFVKAVAKVMGNLAIQMGTMLIATGLGIEALKALGGSAAIIAGIGLVAVGTILSALAGGGGGETPGTGSFSNGGGPGGVVGTQTGVAAQSEFNPAQQGTQIHVNVQGNILDRRESGLEIAQVIQEHFNQNGSLGVVGASS